VPVKPPSKADAENAKNKDDLTFYNTLTRTPAEKPAETQSEQRPGESASKPVSSRNETEAGAESAEAKINAKMWSVQVNSYPDAKSANDLIDRLKNKGYNAFVTEANVKGKTWYRVRVGRFASREEAEKTENALKNNEGYPKAFATRK
jgi:DedD protein